MADRRADAEGVDARGRADHLGEALVIAAPARGGHYAHRVAGLDDVVYGERAEIGGAGERARAARGRDGTALDVDAGQQGRIDVEQALRLVRGEAEILAHAVEHHVDAAGTLQ